jgi:hypothetical protein
MGLAAALGNQISFWGAIALSGFTHDPAPMVFTATASAAVAHDLHEVYQRVRHPEIARGEADHDAGTLWADHICDYETDCTSASEGLIAGLSGEAINSSRLHDGSYMRAYNSGAARAEGFGASFVDSACSRAAVRLQTSAEQKGQSEESGSMRSADGPSSEELPRPPPLDPSYELGGPRAARDHIRSGLGRFVVFGGTPLARLGGQMVAWGGIGEAAAATSHLDAAGGAAAGLAGLAVPAAIEELTGTVARLLGGDLEKAGRGFARNVLEHEGHSVRAAQGLYDGLSGWPIDPRWADDPAYGRAYYAGLDCGSDAVADGKFRYAAMDITTTEMARSGSARLSKPPWRRKLQDNYPTPEESELSEDPPDSDERKVVGSHSAGSAVQASQEFTTKKDDDEHGSTGSRDKDRVDSPGDAPARDDHATASVAGAPPIGDSQGPTDGALHPYAEPITGSTDAAAIDEETAFEHTNDAVAGQDRAALDPRAGAATEDLSAGEPAANDLPVDESATHGPAIEDQAAQNLAIKEPMADKDADENSLDEELAADVPTGDHRTEGGTSAESPMAQENAIMGVATAGPTGDAAAERSATAGPSAAAMTASEAPVVELAVTTHEARADAPGAGNSAADQPRAVAAAVEGPAPEGPETANHEPTTLHTSDDQLAVSSDHEPETPDASRQTLLGNPKRELDTPEAAGQPGAESFKHEPGTPNAPETAETPTAEHEPEVAGSDASDTGDPEHLVSAPDEPASHPEPDSPGVNGSPDDEPPFTQPDVDAPQSSSEPDIG